MSESLIGYLELLDPSVPEATAPQTNKPCEPIKFLLLLILI